MTQARPAVLESLFEPPALAEQERMVEALLFASPAPMTVAELAARMPPGCDVAAAVEILAARYAGRGVRVMRIGPAWAIRTAADLGFLMQGQASAPRRLSRAGIETLAIVAYHQPVTRAEIEEIRGVAVSKGTLDLLLELGWIKLGRRRESPGRPATFVTTQGFLDQFSLTGASDLPGLKELRAAGLAGAPDPGLGLEDDDPEEDAAP